MDAYVNVWNGFGDEEKTMEETLKRFQEKCKGMYTNRDYEQYTPCKD